MENCQLSEMINESIGCLRNIGQMRKSMKNFYNSNSHLCVNEGFSYPMKYYLFTSSF